MKYSTKHKNDLIDLLNNNSDMHFTIEELNQFANSKGLGISQTTLYRLLSELVEEGKVAKYFVDNNHSACYHLLSEHHDCSTHIHMICNKCNKIFHLDCDETEKFLKHIEEEHNFTINPSKIVLYGTCEDCK